MKALSGNHTRHCFVSQYKIISNPLPVYYVVLQIWRSCCRLSFKWVYFSEWFSIWNTSRYAVDEKKDKINSVCSTLSTCKWKVTTDDLLGLEMICGAHSFNKLSAHTCHLPGYAMWKKADGVWLPGVYRQRGEADINQIIKCKIIPVTYSRKERCMVPWESLDLRCLTRPGRSEKACLKRSQLCWKQMDE